MARGVGGQSPSTIAHYLKGIDFPAGKEDLIRHARGQEADEEVVGVLDRMPDQEYGSMADVMKGVGQVD